MIFSRFKSFCSSLVGWLDCPPFGQEIGGCIIPSKVPLSEFFNDCIPPGKRYSFKQVIHQLRVLGRKVNEVNKNVRKLFSALKHQHFFSLWYAINASNPDRAPFGWTTGL